MVDSFLKLHAILPLVVTEGNILALTMSNGRSWVYIIGDDQATIRIRLKLLNSISSWKVTQYGYIGNAITVWLYLQL